MSKIVCPLCNESHPAYDMQADDFGGWDWVYQCGTTGRTISISATKNEVEEWCQERWQTPYIAVLSVRHD